MSTRHLEILVGALLIILGIALGWLCVQTLLWMIVLPWWAQALFIPFWIFLLLAPWYLAGVGLDVIEGKGRR